MRAADGVPATTGVLLCPGPVMLSPGVKTALAACEIGHRDWRFTELAARLRRNCGTVLGAGADHSVMFLTGSATLGIEAACASLFPAESRIVVPVNGAFGTRLVEILSVHGIACTAVDFGCGEAFDLGRLEAEFASLAGLGFAAVAMTHHETSAGIVNPVPAVAALARRHGLKVFVDATSSAGVEDLDVTRDGVDICVTASGKCLHGAPGIAVVCVRRALLEKRATPRPRSYSLDLFRYHEQMEKNSQTPFTPAVPLFLALDKAVEELLGRGGVAERRRQYLRRRALLTAGLRRLGLPLLRLPPGSEACSILTVGVPPSIGFAALYGSLRDRGYIIYGAKPPLDSRYFQVSVMGELTDADLSGFLDVLESTLSGPASLCRAATA
jgi:2-aminoethylphosphonate-pyruvate transaminase